MSITRGSGRVPVTARQTKGEGKKRKRGAMFGEDGCRMTWARGRGHRNHLASECSKEIFNLINASRCYGERTV